MESMFAFQPTGPCNVDRCPKRLGNEMAGLAMHGSIPVLGLVLDLQHCRPRANACNRWESTTACEPGAAVRMLLHTSTVRPQPPRVMIFVHHSALLEAADLRGEGTFASIRDSS